MVIGYSGVDVQPDARPLIEMMEATARWPAVHELRAWERRRLGLRPGQRLLDVGCGLGDVAIALAEDVGPSGSVVGVDASETMLAVARERSAPVGTSIDFRLGDAQALAFGDGSMDACRSERALQWVPDARRGLAEMVRVLRPGGRLSVIETDWRTLTVDVPDGDAVDAFVRAAAVLRGPGFDLGGRVLNLARDAGVADLEVVGAAHVWSRWNPDTESTPPGLFPLQPTVDQLVERGLLSRPMGTRFTASLADAARRDRLSIAVTMFAVSGHRAG
jgi:SAM-dependent methyltransferase